MTDGRWNEVLPLGFPSVSSRIEKAMRMKDTEDIRKQKTMFPTVSRRALPDGKRLGSTCFTARLVTIRVTLDMGSKIASAIVVNRESEPDVTAP